MTGLLVKDLSVTYGANAALHGVSLEVRSGSCLAVLGTNGAGKSSLLNAIAGLVPASAGSIHVGGANVTSTAAYKRARSGIALVPEEHHLFPTMTVRDTLLLASGNARSGPWTVDSVLELFPRLGSRSTSLAGLLSGGERQMVALARGLLLNPDVLLLDEPSAGLAPKVFHEVLDAVKHVTLSGLTVLLAEQNVVGARRIADEFVVLTEGVLREVGDTLASGSGQELTKLLWGA